jgi:hypothetical protein
MGKDKRDLGLNWTTEESCQEIRDENKLLRMANVFIGLGAIVCFVFLSNNSSKSDEVVKNLTFKCDSLLRRYDSLHDENFVNQTTIGRYMLTLDHLKEVNPKAAEEFENFMYTQTE